MEMKHILDYEPCGKCKTSDPASIWCVMAKGHDKGEDATDHCSRWGTRWPA